MLNTANASCLYHSKFVVLLLFPRDNLLTLKKPAYEEPATKEQATCQTSLICNGCYVKHTNLITFQIQSL